MMEGSGPWKDSCLHVYLIVLWGCLFNQTFGDYFCWFFCLLSIAHDLLYRDYRGWYHHGGKKEGFGGLLNLLFQIRIDNRRSPWLGILLHCFANVLLSHFNTTLWGTSKRMNSKCSRRSQEQQQNYPDDVSSGSRAPAAKIQIASNDTNA